MVPTAPVAPTRAMFSNTTTNPLFNLTDPPKIKKLFK
jgi:cystathionine beta-lyase/cystathionine gamma-synthase